MKKISEKRKVEIRAYNRAKQEKEKELKEAGKWVCVFSGLPIPDHVTWKDVSFHHLKGRDGELICDKRFIFPCIDKYHTGDEGYHNKPISFLKNLWWWGGYMNRLKDIDVDLHYREMLKIEKNVNTYECE
jgi:hypothetical protein